MRDEGGGREDDSFWTILLVLFVLPFDSPNIHGDGVLMTISEEEKK